MTHAPPPLSIPQGFSFAGVHAGLKKTRLDLALLACDRPASVAGCFTQNPVRAACIDHARAKLPRGVARAVVINSGNANALTGPQGARDDLSVAAAVAAALDVSADEVFTCSTGVIGVPLAVSKITEAAPALADALSEDARSFSEAILTTDTGPKTADATLRLVDADGVTQTVRVFGVAKGSGMIHPNMATTLGVVCTDAVVAPSALQRLLGEACDASFNAICVDGDTSTNDALLALASGASGCCVETPEAWSAFAAAVAEVLTTLAKAVAADGEGATRLLEVEVQGATDDATARAVARTVCRSSLFKSSVFAGDPAWGRLAAAVGQACLEYAGDREDADWPAPLDAQALRIEAEGVTVYERGAPTAVSRGELLRRLHAPQVRWTVCIGGGPGRAAAYGCDLTYDYVRINADESSQLEVTTSGAVGRKITLGAYTPKLKHELLVDGLAYVRRFSGLRVAVSLKGAVLHTPNLFDAVVRDLELVCDAGLRPMVVVPTASDAQNVGVALSDTAARARIFDPVLPVVGGWLDRGGLAIVPMAPNPGELVARCVKLGVEKLLVLADDQGLIDSAGLVSLLSLEQAEVGLKANRFDAHDGDLLALAGHATTQKLSNLHLIDGRLPHALVAELFTDAGVGTLITRQLAPPFAGKVG